MASPSSGRKPRKKRPVTSSSPINGTTDIDPTTKREAPAFPLVSFFWPVKGASGQSQWITLPCILMVVFLFRWCTALWGYSGFQKPPMHGDFEAQRHWMELTVHLPMTHWYFHDLEWWGLDYPLLTAYHSWILGYVGSFVNPAWFSLYQSRGLDDPGLKVFMRATVVVSEYLIYIPAAVIAVRQLARLHGINVWESSIALTAILMQPATILIDHGHFQYNTVMLGFVLATLACMLAGRPLWSCVFFVAALGFKQMALFYAPVVAAFLSGICITKAVDPLRFIGIAIITVLSFAALYLPFLLGIAYDTYIRQVPLPTDGSIPPLMSLLPGSLTSEKSPVYPFLLQVLQSVHRIFPFQRGLFEDKVANIWCAVHASGIHKLHIYSSATLSRLALALTLGSILPPCLFVFLRPKRESILYAFAATAWGFFLCSYQVHEKNVLLPLLPMTASLAAAGGMKPASRAWVCFANIVACWTLFPLLARDELRVPYFVLTGLWAFLMDAPPFGVKIYRASFEVDGPMLLTKVLHLTVYAAMAAWHVVESFVPPPENKPDLWVVGNVCIGAASFGFCYLWCLWMQLEASELLYDFKILTRKRDVEKKMQ